MEKGKRKMDDNDEGNKMIKRLKMNVENQDDGDDLHLLSRSSAPLWVEELVRKYNGSELRFVATKQLMSLDLNNRYNRLRIPIKNVDAALRPLLSHSELEEANFVRPIKDRSAAKKTMMSGEAGMTESGAGLNHGGLEVSAFTRAGWRFFLRLSCWEHSMGSTILRGDEWRHFRVFSGIQLCNEVDIWCFREGPARKLCFIIAKTMAIVIT